MYFELASDSPLRMLSIYPGLIPANEYGAVLLAAMLAPLLLLYFCQNALKRISARIFLLIPAIALFGAYVASSRYMDDLFVNFQHPFNLMHHGRLSMSTLKMVDGTVEFFYYLLLSLFSYTRYSLIIANYLLDFAIALGHLYIVSLFLKKYRPSTQLLCLVLFATYIPLVQTFSTGYGNGLVSLVLLWGIYNLNIGRTRWVWFCCAALPLLRPEASLYSGCLLLLDLAVTRKFRWQGWFLTFCSFAGYFILVKIFYGHFVPTAMTFRGASLDDILFQDRWSRVKGMLSALFRSPFHLVYIPISLFFLFRRSSSGQDQQKDSIQRKLAATWFLTMFGVFLFFRFMDIGYNPTIFRYYVGFELAIIVIVTMGVARVLEHPRVQRIFAGPQDFSLMQLSLAGGFCVLFSGLVYVSLEHDDGHRVGIEMGSWDIKRLNVLMSAGQWLGQITPAQWRIASTEMNSFGYMSDRQIVDLWGYSNPTIASSKIENPYGIKSNPNVFLDSNAEIMWVRTVLDDKGGQLAMGSTPENFLVSFPNLSKWLNQLGDIRAVVEKYDLYRIYHGNGQITALLVRKDLRPQFGAIMQNAGFKMIQSRPLDMDQLSKLYARN